MTHEPECPYVGRVVIEPEGMPWLGRLRIARMREEIDRTCICEQVRKAYTRGYNARATSGAISHAVYGIPDRATQHGRGENP